MNTVSLLKEKFYSKPQSERRAVLMSGIFFIICTLMGVFFHFAFKLLGGYAWLAPFVPVNESIWEHLKLIFVPYILFLMPIEYFLYGRHLKRFVSSRLIGVIAAMSFVVMEFYTIKGAFGEPPAAVNIIIYCIATLIAYIIPLFVASHARGDDTPTVKFISLVALAAIFAVFIAFTFYPPKLPLFLDPTGAGYGYYMFDKQL